MPKTREKNSEEFYRGKLREAHKEIRQLRKQLKYFEKKAYGESQDVEDIGINSDDTHPEIKETKRYCLSEDGCGKGILKEFVLLDRVFEECDTCGYRKRIK